MPRKLLPLVVSLATAAVLGTACSSTSAVSGTPGTDVASAKGCDSGAMVDQPLFSPATDTSPRAASYSSDAVAAQAKDCEGMRTFLATPQPGFDLQSYVFYGHLESSDGEVIPFSTMTQRQAAELGTTSSAALRVSAMTVNTGDGVTIGGIDGVPSATETVSYTTNPFSLRTQSATTDAAPQYVDARVVEGQLGQPGAVIELTGQLTAEKMSRPGGPTVPLQVSVRLRDVAGVGQWGYGPSGFFPQWLLPGQHAAVTGEHGGDVGAYLAATGEPMTDQGSYYYSSPVVEVESFTISEGGSVVASGTGGEVLVDYVTQSFDAAAAAVVEGGVEWSEFSTLLGGRTMKVGVVEQSSVGTLPYAIELRADGHHLANGSLEASRRWPIGSITLTPDTSATWTSPRSGKTYVMRYTAELAGHDGSSSASLTYEAVIDDQELSVAGRTVYEGLYRVTGTLDGRTVHGYAWAEIQPSGTV